MPRIPLTSGFQLISEGTHIFFIYKVEYDEDFGKMKIHMVNAKGVTHIERFSLKNADGEYNDRAVNAFSYFARQALDASPDDIEPEELVGHFIEADVVHNKVPSTSDPTKMMTFVNLSDKAPANGFLEQASPRAQKLIDEVKGRGVEVPYAETTDTNDELDIDKLLGI